MGDGDEMTARPFPCSSAKKEKGEMGEWRLASRSFQGGLAGNALLLYSVREVYSAVVWGQCVWVKITPVAAPRERWQDTFEAHERGLSGRLSAGCCSRGQEDETELRSDRQHWGKLDHPSGERQNHGTNNTAGFNPGANSQCRTVTESIIYFRTLDMSLRFLGR